MEVSIVATCVGVGLLLILIELFLIPGTTVVGFFGFFVSLTGIFFGYRFYGNTIGSGIAVSTLIIASLSFYWAIKIGAWKLFSLKDDITGKTTNIDENLKVGDIGTTTSALRPSGEAVFGSYTSEVTSYGAFVESGTSVKIVEITRNKIFIEPH